MNEKENLHVLYKNIGETPLQCMERWRLLHPELKGVPMTYAGRLDPMAEGLLLVLSLGAVHDKEKYTNLPKTYSFEILWGIGTDTLDILGLVENTAELVPSEDDVKKKIEESPRKFEQKYPAFSSRPVNGKPLFQWAREGKIDQIEIPSHEVEIFSAEFISRRNVSHIELLTTIEERVGKVSGDFRQAEIVERWRETLQEREYVIDSLLFTVSSGFYVRQFVRDMSKAFGTDGIVMSIMRTKIGSYQLS